MLQSEDQGLCYFVFLVLIVTLQQRSEMILWMLNNHEVNWIDTVFICKEETTPVLLWFTNI